MFSQQDIQQIAARGTTLKAVDAQIDHFRRGFPWVKVVGPATPDRGIAVLTPDDEEAAIRYGDSAPTAGRSKFVPASGAASRMFKDIFAGLSALEGGNDLPADSPGALLSSRIEDFAFYDARLFGRPSDTPGYRRDTLRKVLTDAGLGYGTSPKGVVRFHRYADGEVRTAIAEHLVEAQEYLRGADGTCRLTVTISPEHRPLFEAALDEVRARYEARYGVRYDVTFTCQDPATDTIAVDLKNRPFRTDDGALLFRPAGHGALIHNLAAVPDELVCIKNIDNVAHGAFPSGTARYKKVLIGEALQLRDRIFGYLRRFDALADLRSEAAHQLCNEVEDFLDRALCIQVPLAHDAADRAALLRAKLDRPIRVCGMVRNEGEPGGGPFIIAGKDGATSLQILESVQLNKEDRGAMDAMARATHFNPVDLVCCLHDYKGRPFDLLRHVDPEAGFISSKSYEGRELKALELPGLWNGAMSDWNTRFVEVPLSTFNPVKVVLDLLRPAHRPA